MASKNKHSLADFTSVSDEELQKIFLEEYKKVKEPEDLKTIFNIAITDKSLFPEINNANSPTDYITRWVSNYSNATLPSQRTAEPKGSCSDPAIKTIVQYIMKINEVEALEQERHHNLFMSAENIQGNLLEEYINNNIRPFGWLWCKGNVLRAVDFCTKDGCFFLQVKNKSNTENSSSSAIRNGTQIQKWYRLGTKTVRGIKMPSYKWDTLNDIINEHSQTNTGEKCAMSENDYIAFLKGVATRNNNLISDK